MIKKSMAMMVVLIMLGLLLACAQPAEVSPTLVLSPASGPGKAVINILGAGFQPGEQVEVIMVVDGQPIGLGRRGAVGVVRETVNQEGAFMFPGHIPNPLTAAPGVYILTAKGDRGSVAICPLNIEEVK